MTHVLATIYPSIRRGFTSRIHGVSRLKEIYLAKIQPTTAFHLKHTLESTQKYRIVRVPLAKHFAHVELPKRSH